MSRTAPLACLCAAIGALSGCGGGGDVAEEGAAAPGPQVTVPLREQNASGQKGTATLTALDEQSFEVAVAVTPPRKRSLGYQLVHLHKGSCAEYARFRTYEEERESLADQLQDTDEHGRSTSTVYAPLAERLTGEYSINVHEELRSYEVVACGDVPRRR